MRLLNPEDVADLVLANDRYGELRRSLREILTESRSGEPPREAVDLLRKTFLEQSAGHSVSSRLYGEMPEILRKMVDRVDWNEATVICARRMNIRSTALKSRDVDGRKENVDNEIEKSLARAFLGYVETVSKDDPEIGASELESKIMDFFSSCVYGALSSSVYRKSWNLVTMLRDSIDWRRVSEEALRLVRDGKK